MSKRAKKNLLKIQNNDELDEVTKQEKLDQITKRQKTSEGQSRFYVDGEKSQTQDSKLGVSTLWDEHEKSFLDDATINFVENDEVMQNTKGKTVMKWDSKKKKY